MSAECEKHGIHMYIKSGDSWPPDYGCYACDVERLEARNRALDRISRVRLERLTMAEAKIVDLQRWKDAITDASVVNWTLSAENENDPRRAIADLVAEMIRESNDPLVSEEAATAHEHVRTLATYATHKYGCGPGTHSDVDEERKARSRPQCTCGLVEALAEVEEPTIADDSAQDDYRGETR